MNQIKTVIFFLFVGFSFQAVAQQDLTLLDSLRKTKDEVKRIGILNIIGRNYQKERAYKKSLTYLHEARSLQRKQNVPENQQTHTLKALSGAHIYLKNYDSANYFLNELLTIRKKQNDTKQIAEILGEMSYVSQIATQNPKALTYSLEQAQLLESNKDQESLLGVYNNVGFLYSQTGDKNKSLEYYKKAIQLGESLSKNEKNARKKSIILLNTGASYANIGDYKTSKDVYLQALSIVEPLKNPAYTADVKNYLAANYYISGNNSQAIESAQEAIQLAESINNKALLATSYRIIAEVYRQEGDFRESQRYDRLYQELKDKADEELRQAEQEALQKEAEVERKEGELNQILSEKERSESALRESKLQQDKQKQELLAAEEREKVAKIQLQNQKLQQERTEQMLALAEARVEQEAQRRIAEVQKQEADNQRQEAEKQRLLAEKNNAESLGRQKELEASKEREQAQSKQLKQEQVLRQYGVGLLILGALLLVFMIIAFIASKRAAQRLRLQNAQIMQQKEEIASQNEELYQNQEEIIAQKEFIGKQKEELEESSNKLTSSIRYAQTIQDAILPFHERLIRLFQDYFVIYKPKDIVAGDFYWIEDIGENKVLAAVLDCTGHGVPGAFMSMIGYAIMNEIVNTKRIIQPAAILEKLHHDVRKALRQEDSNNKDGMDVCMTLIERNEDEIVLYFAGAKLPLYYTKGKELIEISGSRKSIGGIQNPNKSFEEHRLVVPEGTCIYLASDGLIDQSNFDRKKFGKQKIQEIILENQGKSFAKQKEILENALSAHQGKAEQRDDITFIGLKI